MYRIYMFISSIRDIQHTHITKILILQSGDVAFPRFPLKKQTRRGNPDCDLAPLKDRSIYFKHLCASPVEYGDRTNGDSLMLLHTHMKNETLNGHSILHKNWSRILNWNQACFKRSTVCWKKTHPLTFYDKIKKGRTRINTSWRED